MGEFPDEEREPVYVKEGQGAVLLCVPPKAWPRMYMSSRITPKIHHSNSV